MAELPADVVDALRDEYALERVIGRGGMATVYLAQDLKHKRPVALKLLHPELSSSLGSRRFRLEIETAARLHHPHICAVYDSGEFPGVGNGPPRLWFTMPFVRGESLRERLRREGKLPIEQALRITREAAEALHYAHDEGVVHRDIKPENILLSDRGTTLVADFGVARPMGIGEGQHLTQAGLAVGTPTYMAPEQALAEGTVDARADQYALAATCYEMLAGAPPFTSPTAAAIIATRFREPTPSVRASRPEVSPPSDQALQRALALEPGDRFDSVAEFARSLVEETGAAVPAPRHRRIVPVLGAAVAAVVVAGGFLAWTGAGGSGTLGPSAAPKVLAVLPFENLGDSSDAYFADGVTDEVRTKLAQVGGLEVIARSSSNEYRHSGKPPQEIARELGADYLLSGTVRWEKPPGGASRVRVIPELVDVRPGQAPLTRWGQQFEAATTDVFAVQADIASQVASALDLALSAGTVERMAARPTRNVEAYTAYLRGKELRAGEHSPEALRAALAEFRGAVALDSRFAAAWAELGLAQLDAFRQGGSQSKDAEAAGRSVERASALAPESPDTRLASGWHQLIARGNPVGALAEYRAGLQISPGRADLLSATAAAEMSLGRWAEALIDLEHAARLDPRSPTVLGELSDVSARMGRLQEARTAIDRARELRPASMSLAYTNARIAAAEGDLDEVRAILQSMDAIHGPRAVVAYVALREDLIWALDDERQRLLLQLTPADLDGGKADWALALAETHWLRGEHSRARAYGNTAVTEFATLLYEWGDRAGRGQIMALRAMALAYAGRTAEATAEGEQASETQPPAEKVAGPYSRYLLARIYLLAGEPEKAMDRIEEILKVPDFFSPAWIRIDPTLAGLKRSARYREVVGPR